MLKKIVLLVSAFVILAAAAFAQSPNTSTVVVLVTDQSGAVVNDARVSVTNNQTGAVRASTSGVDGSATFPALSLTGTYTVTVTKQGFATEEHKDISLRAGETATLRVKLVLGTEKSEVTVYGTNAGVRADPQIGGRLDSPTVDETPILGRKITTLPLFNSAFRQGKGTGDLFVNATYFITGSGSRRTTTFMLDGASNDEGWGRQTMLAAVPVGAVQEVSVLSNAFSAEFGWTAGPAFNIVTKSGTNALHGEGLYLARPSGSQATSFSTKGFCAPSVSTCTTPTTLAAINPADNPDALDQFSGSIGGPIVKDKTFFFLTSDYTMQDRTTYLSPTLPAYVLPADGSLSYVGHYRQGLVNARLDHKLRPNQMLMWRFNVDHMYDTNPNDAVVGTSAPTVARRYTRKSWTTQLNHTTVLGGNLLNEVRVAYLHGDPVTLWESQDLSTTYTRGGSAPFTIGESRSSDLYSHQFQVADTLTWNRGPHNVRFGGSLTRHSTGGFGSEPGTAILGTFTFLSTTTEPFEQLTLADVQQYSEPVSYGVTDYKLEAMDVGGVRAGQHPAERSVHGGRWLALRPSDIDRRDRELRAAPGIQLASEQRPADRGPRRLRDVLHADSRERDCQCVDRRTRRSRDLYLHPRTDRVPDLSDVRSAEDRSKNAAPFAAARSQHHDSGRSARLLHIAVRVLRPELRSAAELPGRVRQSPQPGDVDWRRT